MKVDWGNLSTLSIILMLTSAAHCWAQDPCLAEGRLKAVLEKARIHGTETGSLSLTTEPGLRERYISFELDFHDRLIIQGVCAYKLTPEHFHFTGNSVPTMTVDLDSSEPELYVISSAHKVYLLGGFATGSAEFNELMTDIGLDVDSAAKAMSVFDFFSLSVFGQDYRSRILGDNLKLLSVAAEDFRIRFPAVRRDEEFQKWWDSIKARRTAIAPPRAYLSGRRFEIKFDFYDLGSIRRRLVFVGLDGKVSEI